MDVRSRPRIIQSTTGTKDLQMVCTMPYELYSMLIMLTIQ